MRTIDHYHKWIEWSEEDHAYIGKCPDLITGIHGDDPVKLYSELYEVVEDVIQHFESDGRTLPISSILPMKKIA
jgi:predicted RNase H-like HicB family nuclease